MQAESGSVRTRQPLGDDLERLASVAANREAQAQHAGRQAGASAAVGDRSAHGPVGCHACGGDARHGAEFSRKLL